jgi:putative Mn2+ efflux pump MntP
MTPLAVVLLAFAMATDAFAAAIAKGLQLADPGWREALRTGAIFGAIEAVTPVIGWGLGSVAARLVADWDHWIAFALLGLLGLRMVASGFRADAEAPEEKPERHGFWILAVTGFATSIDAMAVGASLAFVEIAIVPVAIAIGLATFTMVTAGVLLARGLGAVAGRRAEMAGGVVLIAIGATILAEHLRAG